MSILRFRKSGGHSPDYPFILLILLLTVFGLVMLSSASSDLGKIKFKDPYYHLKHQLLYGLSLGIVGFIGASFLNYRWWQKLAFPLLIIGLVCLTLVFTPLGLSHSGSNRWVNIGEFSFQPAELLKLIFIIYLAAWFSDKKSRQTDFSTGFLPFLVVCGAVTFLILIQPSTTTVAIIMSSALIVYFASGAKLRYIAGTIILGIAVLACFVCLTDYRIARVTTFWQTIMNGSSSVNVEGQGYHINQSLIAIGSGGLFGVGLGQSVLKYKYLPEPIGDSIFAVIAEELGFIGASLLIIVFLTFLLRGFMIAKKSCDQFARLTVIGFMCIIGIQTFIHIAAISGIMPLTGVPLPFISYGGTSLVIFLTMSGIIVNISKYT